MSEGPTSFSADSYFATQPGPSTLEHDIAGVKEFVSRQANEGRNVVLVTVRDKILCSRMHLMIRTCNNRAAEQPFLWSSMCEPSAAIDAEQSSPLRLTVVPPI
jgi:hypothetical protein